MLDHGLVTSLSTETLATISAAIFRYHFDLKNSTVAQSFSSPKKLRGIVSTARAFGFGYRFLVVTMPRWPRCAA